MATIKKNFKNVNNTPKKPHSKSTPTFTIGEKVKIKTIGIIGTVSSISNDLIEVTYNQTIGTWVDPTPSHAMFKPELLVKV